MASPVKIPPNPPLVKGAEQNPSLQKGGRGDFFLPYQVRWISDPARFKIVEKSRRTGFTYCQSYEDVRDAARADNPLDVWFSSADESAAKEYIRYCEQWTKLFKVAAESLGEMVIDKADDIKALVVQFSSGKRIHALSSNPKAMRSKGGKLVLDEYAFHKNPEEMWKAAAPVITWGFPVRVLSTYNGKGNRYYRMVEEAKKGNRWSLHTVTIEDAVAAGLVDKVLGRKATAAERAAFLLDCREIAGDEETYQQEYMCVPVDEATAWLTWDLITSAEHAEAGKPELYQGGDCYVGMDIGRRRDLTVIWVDEKIGDVLWNREIVKMKGASFAEQDAEMDRVFSRYKVRRCCMDQGGMGEKPVEDAKRRYGEYAVEGILFTGPVKQHLATLIKQAYEDRRTRTPADRELRDSHHAVRKLTTIAGNPRFDADRSEVGHADEFWAHALACHAAEDSVQPSFGVSVGTPEEIKTVFTPERFRSGMGGLLRRYTHV